MFGQSAAGGTSLFGAPAPAPGGGGSLFGGAQPQPGTSMFGGGQQTGGTSLFGGGGQQAGTSLFGGGAQQTGGASLFGGGAQQQPGGSSLFGGGAGQQTGGTSMFGGGTQPAAGGSLFGGGAQQTGGGSMFGGGGQQLGGGSMFGGQSTGTGLLGGGATTSGGLFGGGAGAGTSLSLGGGGGGLFQSAGSNRGSMAMSIGQPSGLGFGSSLGQPAFGSQLGFGNPMQQQQRMDEETEHVVAISARGDIPKWYKELVNIQAAYRVCQFSQFQTFMYEVAPTAPDIHRQFGDVSIALVEQTRNARKEQFRQQIPWLDEIKPKWQQFEDQNPDPANWIPCPIVGIDAFRDRVEAQQKYTNDQLNSVDQDRNRTWLSNAAADIQSLDQTIEMCRREHAKVRRRLVSVLGRLEQLKARHQIKGPRTPSEIRFHERLEKIRRVLDDPKGCKTRLLEIERRLGEVLSESNRPPLDIVPKQAEPVQRDKTAEQRKQEEETEQKIKQLTAFLDDQRRSMAAVIETLRRDARDVKLMRGRILN